MIDQWTTEGEIEVAEWFRNEYLTEPFTGWHTSSSGIPGNTPNNNSQESYHRNEKRGDFGEEMGVYLSINLKEDLKNAAIELSEGDIVLAAPGVPSTKVHLKASNLIAKHVTNK